MIGAPIGHPIGAALFVFLLEAGVELPISLTGYILDESSRAQLVSGVSSDEAENGEIHVINLSDEPRYDVACVVEGLTAVERSTLMTALESNPTEIFTVSVEGDTYSGRLNRSREPNWAKADGFYKVTFTLRATKD
jgi:hypothetical protein